MANVINATSTGNGGLVSTGDDSGILNIQTNETTAITVNASQQVGVGATPSAQLQVFCQDSVSGKAIRAAYDGTYYSDYTENAINCYNNNYNINVKSGSNLIFKTADTERMRIDSSGNLLVGVTSPSGGFNTIAATGSNWALVAKNLSTSGSVYGFKSLLSYAPNNTSSYFIGCEDNGTGRMYVYSNGNVVNTNNSYGAISDRTLKENIVDASPKLENLCKVKIRNFNLIGETTKQLGVVAQELEEIFPSMVEVDGNTQKKQVKYSVFVPMLVKAIQELKAINDTQAETINALTARVVALEGK